MKRLVLAIICLLFIISLNAQSIITFNNGGTGAGTTGSYKLGNSFTATQDGILSKVKVLSLDARNGLVLDIYQGEGVAGTKLGTITGGSTHAATTYTDYSEFDISSNNISVTNSNVYTFYFSTYDVNLYYNSTSMGSGGQMYQYFDGSVQTNSSYDLYCEIELADTPLPIELIDFTTTAVNGAVELTWQTATETDNAHFLIYRNGEVITSIEGAGTTSEPQNYEFTDNNVIPGASYTYMLADLSYANEETKYTDKAITIVIPENDIPTEFTLDANYPNPFNPRTYISFQLSAVSDVELSIYDMNGTKVTTLISDNKPAGYYEVNWDASDFSSGIYFYRLQAGDFVDTKKMILMK